MELIKLETEKINKIRECLVGEYIGTWNKPKEYFSKLKEIDIELELRMQNNN